MAATAIVNTVLSRNTPAAYTAPAALNASDGALITAAADEKMLIILEATAAGSAVIKAGNGLQGVKDLTVTFSAAGTQCVNLESGAFVNVSGENRGKIQITGPANIKAACVVLP